MRDKAATMVDLSDDENTVWMCGDVLDPTICLFL